MTTRAPFVVTIDGPAGAGKSTVSRRLAEALGFVFLDTGAIYRSLAWAARDAGIAWNDGDALGQLAIRLGITFRREGDKNRVFLADREVTDVIRTPEISVGASQVSAHPQVRAALLGLQRRIAEGADVVAEGRDCGTVVFPSAQAKFFLTASVEERARRRTQELVTQGQSADPAAVRADIVARDERDRTRDVAPLQKALDALEIDSAGQAPEHIVEQMASVVRARMARGS